MMLIENNPRLNPRSQNRTRSSYFGTLDFRLVLFPMYLPGKVLLSDFESAIRFVASSSSNQQQQSHPTCRKKLPSEPSPSPSAAATHHASSSNRQIYTANKDTFNTVLDMNCLHNIIFSLPFFILHFNDTINYFLSYKV